MDSWRDYLGSNPRLYSGGHRDPASAADHWNNLGRFEGRKMARTEPAAVRRVIQKILGNWVPKSGELSEVTFSVACQRRDVHAKTMSNNLRNAIVDELGWVWIGLTDSKDCSPDVLFHLVAANDITNVSDDLPDVVQFVWTWVDPSRGVPTNFQEEVIMRADVVAAMCEESLSALEGAREGAHPGSPLYHCVEPGYIEATVRNSPETCVMHDRVPLTPKYFSHDATNSLCITHSTRLKGVAKYVVPENIDRVGYTAIMKQLRSHPMARREAIAQQNAKRMERPWSLVARSIRRCLVCNLRCSFDEVDLHVEVGNSSRSHAWDDEHWIEMNSRISDLAEATKLYLDHRSAIGVRIVPHAEWFMSETPRAARSLFIVDRDEAVPAGSGQSIVFHNGSHIDARSVRRHQLTLSSNQAAISELLEEEPGLESMIKFTAPLVNSTVFCKRHDVKPPSIGANIVAFTESAANVDARAMFVPCDFLDRPRYLRDAHAAICESLAEACEAILCGCGVIYVGREEDNEWIVSLMPYQVRMNNIRFTELGDDPVVLPKPPCNLTILRVREICAVQNRMDMLLEPRSGVAVC